jgi:vacuolar-type H+-ATPase subunit E/Vma4
VQQRDDYGQIAIQLLREALLHLNADTARIRADVNTAKYYTSQVIDQVSAELKIKIQSGQPLEHDLGVIAETSDGHRRYDNTLQTRINRIQNSLRAHVYEILSGKSS